MKNELKENMTTITYSFECKTHKQKLLLDALLRYSHLDLTGLSSILHVLTSKLRDVHRGTDFLENQDAKQLALLFLICFSE